MTDVAVPRRALVEARNEQFEGRHFVFLIGSIAHFGGAERQALTLAKMLREEVGARVSFLAWIKAPGIMTDHLENAGIHVHVHPLDWQHRLTWRKAAIPKAMRLIAFTRFVRNTVRPDYLLPYIGVNSKVAGLIWRAAGARYTWWNQRDEGRLIYGSRLERWILDKVPEVVSNSWDGRDFLVEKCGVAYERVKIINNAVPIPAPSDGSEWRARLGLSDGDRLALMAANFTDYKDHDTLLRAFARTGTESERPRYHLALAGRADETALTLKGLAFDLGLGGRVHFVGAISDMDPLYEAADLVVHSSIAEGCPNAVLEGMAHAKCVVGTDIGGLRQALGEEQSSRFLAPPKDVDALAAKMTSAFRSDEMRSVAGAANRKRIVDEFSPGRLLGEVLDGIRKNALAR
ncbi:MAG: glycosyltransferase family 4 protein [Gemmatimonadales bacterium]